MSATSDANRIRHQDVPPPPTYGYLFEYAILDDLRFLSHHDEITMLRRSMVRAGLPLAHSRGFNPIPQMSLLLPRNVGVASAIQFAQVKLNEDLETSDVFDKLQRSMPEQAPLRSVVRAPRKSVNVVETTFAVQVDDDDVATVPARIDSLIAAKTHFLDRDMGPKKPVRKTDIRGFVRELRLTNHELQMRLQVERQASARPAEILNALGLPPAKYLHRVCRTELIWQETN